MLPNVSQDLGKGELRMRGNKDENLSVLSVICQLLFQTLPSSPLIDLYFSTTVNFLLKGSVNIGE